MSLKKFFEKNIDTEKILKDVESEEKLAQLIAHTAVELAKKLNTPKKIGSEKFLRTMFSVMWGKTVSKETFKNNVSVNLMNHLDILEQQNLRIQLMHYLKDYQGQNPELLHQLIAKGITNNRLLLSRRNSLDDASAEKAHNLIWNEKKKQPKVKKESLKEELKECKKEVEKLKNALKL